MFQEKISYKEALEKQSTGEITIIDCSPESIPIFNQSWRDNLQTLRKKVPSIAINKLPEYFQAKYLIEYVQEFNNDTSTASWRYFHGIENTQLKSKIKQEGVEYIYILTNKGYPGIVKIGMTVYDVEKRVESINATGTLYEWEAMFAVPVSKGNAYKVEQSVHKAFNMYRVTSNLGNTREFFKVEPTTALDKVLSIGALFRLGEVITY